MEGRPGIRWDEATGLPPKWEMKHAKAYVWHPYGYSEMTGLVNASFEAREVGLFPVPHMMLVKSHFEGALEFMDQPGEPSPAGRRGDAVIPHCHGLPLLRDLYDNPAVIAMANFEILKLFCQKMTLPPAGC